VGAEAAATEASTTTADRLQGGATAATGVAAAAGVATSGVESATAAGTAATRNAVKATATGSAGIVASVECGATAIAGGSAAGGVESGTATGTGLLEVLSAKGPTGTFEEGADRLGDDSHVAAVNDLMLSHEALGTVIEDDGNAGGGCAIAFLFKARGELAGSGVAGVRWAARAGLVATRSGTVGDGFTPSDHMTLHAGSVGSGEGWVEGPAVVPRG
jgi:hypothetical protein